MKAILVFEIWEQEAKARGYTTVVCNCNNECDYTFICHSVSALDSAGNLRGMFKINMKYGYFYDLVS